jgi:hypothetical protein
MGPVMALGASGRIEAGRLATPFQDPVRDAAIGPSPNDSVTPRPCVPPNLEIGRRTSADLSRAV